MHWFVIVSTLLIVNGNAELCKQSVTINLDITNKISKIGRIWATQMVSSFKLEKLFNSAKKNGSLVSLEQATIHSSRYTGSRENFTDYMLEFLNDDWKSKQERAYYLDKHKTKDVISIGGKMIEMKSTGITMIFKYANDTSITLSRTPIGHTNLTDNDIIQYGKTYMEMYGTQKTARRLFASRFIIHLAINNTMINTVPDYMFEIGTYNDNVVVRWDNTLLLWEDGGMRVVIASLFNRVEWNDISNTIEKKITMRIGHTSCSQKKILAYAYMYEFFVGPYSERHNPSHKFANKLYLYMSTYCMKDDMFPCNLPETTTKCPKNNVIAFQTAYKAFKGERDYIFNTCELYQENFRKFTSEYCFRFTI